MRIFDLICTINKLSVAVMKTKFLLLVLLSVFFSGFKSFAASAPSIDPDNSYTTVGIGQNRFAVQSMWFYSPSTSNPCQFDKFTNQVFTSMAVASGKVYISYCLPEDSEVFLLEYDAATGKPLRKISLSGLPSSTVAVSDIFTDSEGHLCGCTKAFDGAAESDAKLIVYEIGADGAVGSLHELEVSAKRDVVSSCRIVGDIRGDFSVWAAGSASSDVRILYWATPTTKVKVYATGLQTNSDYNMVEPIDSSHLYLAADGNYLQTVDFSDGVEVTSLKTSVKRSCAPAVAEVTGEKMLAYVTSCSRTADVKFGVATVADPSSALWTLPASGLGYSSLCQSPQAWVKAVKFNDYETHIYLYSVGIGLAAYSLYDVVRGGVEPVASDAEWQVEGNKLRFGRPVSASVFDLSGREVLRSAQTDEISLSSLCKGCYVVTTDGGIVVKMVNR